MESPSHAALASGVAAGLRVAVAGHKPYWVPGDPRYVPVQAGASGRDPIPGFLRDDGGENISAKNPGYCELTALYWAWRNLDAEWLGLAHYRRHFAARAAGGRRARVASAEDIAGALAREPLVLPRPRNYLIETNWSQYAHAHHEADLEAAREVISESQPAYLRKFDEVMARTWGHRFNMFVAHRDIADAWCAWLFGVLGELEARLDTGGYSANDARVFGFVAERLIDVWVEANGLAYVEMPVVNLESQHWLRKGAAFIARKVRG